MRLLISLLVYTTYNLLKTHTSEEMTTRLNISREKRIFQNIVPLKYTFDNCNHILSDMAYIGH